ncbi:hypothetical protein P0136_02140 [Lentisphaerota bacterium ZTH]|nr:hypothetical protein JYG24_06720 [Lentisphaerota bacterium]WET06806.1 hypothetical protein P0136_02140 [Lentisphaerota bacterium ZTH]
MSLGLPMSILIVVSFLTWLVFVVTACKIYRFFNEFEKFKGKNDAELNSLVWHVKKIETSFSETILELRRISKLLYEIRGGSALSDKLHEVHSSEVNRLDKVDKYKLEQITSQPVDTDTREINIKAPKPDFSVPSE